VIFHFDISGEYVGDLAQACSPLGVTRSMGRVSSALDNAAADSFGAVALSWAGIDGPTVRHRLDFGGNGRTKGMLDIASVIQCRSVGRYSRVAITTLTSRLAGGILSRLLTTTGGVLRQTNWGGPVIIGAFALTGPTALRDTSVFGTLTLTGIYAIAVVGLALLSGVAGQVSLGQMGLVATGSYGSAIATVRWGLPPLVGVVVGLTLTLLVALPASAVLRLRGANLALATLAFGILMAQLVTNLASWTGGVNGYVGIQPLELWGLRLGGDDAMFMTAWLLTALGLIVNGNLLRSRFGRGLRAAREDEDAARSVGVPTFRYKVTAWLIAAAYASLAGSLYAHHLQFIAPEQFSVRQSVTLVAAVVVGGTASFAGPVLALATLRLLPEVLGSGPISPAAVTGLLLIVVMVLSADGLAGGARWFWRRLPAGAPRATGTD
jgi:branched-chain amino acid transport system permease protein